MATTIRMSRWITPMTTTTTSSGPWRWGGWPGPSTCSSSCSSTPTSSHGTAQGQLSSLEKVMGRSRSVQVQIVTTDEELASLTELLKQRFKGTGLRYWASALSTEGEVA